MTTGDRLAELRAIAQQGEHALAEECTRILERHTARPLTQQEAARLTPYLGRLPRLADQFERGMIVELDPRTVEFRRFGDRYATVVSARDRNVRVWLHTSKRLRSVRASRLRATGDIDVRDPMVQAVEADRLPPPNLLALLDNVLTRRSERVEA